jgi:hypothetical protein
MASRAAITGGSVVAVTCLIVALVVVIVRGDSAHGGSAAPAGVPSTILSGGHRVPYAGPVPWANPVTDPNDPSEVYVFADNDRVDADNICWASVDRAVVTHADTRSISVEVAGYTPTYLHGPACAGLGHSPARVAVHLGSPLRGRRLIDANDGATHRILDATTVPDIHRLPPGCGPAMLTWNEHTGVATRQFESHHCLIAMTYASTDAVNAVNAILGTARTPVQVRGATATVTTYNDINNYEFSLQWTPTPDHAIRLVINSPTQQPISAHVVLAAARSIS